jgi:hypothetical protein
VFFKGAHGELQGPVEVVSEVSSIEYICITGRELCDKMCKDGYSPEEIVEFFKTFVSKKMKIEMYMKNFLKNHKTSDKVRLFLSA